MADSRKGANEDLCFEPTTWRLDFGYPFPLPKNKARPRLTIIGLPFPIRKKPIGGTISPLV